MMKTSISFPAGLGYITYEKDYIAKILESRLQIVPGFERLANVIKLTRNGVEEKTSFLFSKNDKRIELEIHIVVLPRTQVIAVSADIKELLFYVFKHDLGIELSNVKVYVEA